MKFERFLAQQDKATLAASIDLTRRMRMAAVKTEPNQPLTDAEALIGASAALIIAGYTKASQAEERDHAETLIAHFGETYETFEKMQKSDPDDHNARMVTAQVEEDFTGFALFWDSTADRYTRHNSLWVTRSAMIDANRTAFSPLSRDYLTAKTLSSYVQQVEDRAIAVEPVAYDKDTYQVVFRNDLQERLPSYPEGGINVFVDTISSNLTASIVAHALEQHNPDAEIRVMTMRRRIGHYIFQLQ